MEYTTAFQKSSKTNRHQALKHHIVFERVYIHEKRQVAGPKGQMHVKKFNFPTIFLMIE